MFHYYLLLGISLLPLPLYAQSKLCEQVPDCAKLGFTTTYDETCADDGYLTCPFNAQYRKCVKRSCNKMGFTSDDKSSWCEKIITCPEDNTYTACVKLYENPCPDGYDPTLTSVAKCGKSGSRGWLLDSFEIAGNNGPVTCGKCTPKACEGDPTKTTYSSCTANGHENGWNYSSCYYGDELRGTCTKKTCSDYSYSNSCPEVWQNVSVYLGDNLATCYKCASCISSGAATNCVNGCKYVCADYPTRPNGYPEGSCPNEKINWPCCSYGAKPTGRPESEIYTCGSKS